MEQSVESGDVSIRKLGGLNQRVSPLDLAPNEFSVLRGYYPSQEGLLSRLPGKEFLFQLDGTILSIHPTYNSEGHILIQTTENLYLTTIDEIQGRTTETNLTSNPDPNPGGGSVLPIATEVLFYVRKAAGVDGDVDGSLTGSTYSIKHPIWTDQIIPTGTQSFVIDWNNVLGNITIPIGEYIIEVTQSHYTAVAGIKFYHTLGGVVGIGDSSVSTPVISDASSTCFTYSQTYINLSSVGTITISSVSNGADGTTLQGKANNLGEQEYYSILKIIKL
jgi:hypothetical protein